MSDTKNFVDLCKLERLVELAWDAWAALDHNREEHLVGKLAQALEDLGYPTHPDSSKIDLQSIGEAYDDFLSTRL